MFQWLKKVGAKIVNKITIFWQKSIIKIGKVLAKIGNDFILWAKIKEDEDKKFWKIKRDALQYHPVVVQGIRRRYNTSIMMAMEDGEKSEDSTSLSSSKFSTYSEISGGAHKLPPPTIDIDECFPELDQELAELEEWQAQQENEEVPALEDGNTPTSTH